MDFFFREYGEGKPIIILHGYLGMSDHWISIGKFLSTIGYKVYIPDMPNHGKSFHTDSFSYKEMGEILNVFAEAKSAENAIIIGHSMGGKIAMEMINQKRDFYKAIIIVDIHFKDYNNAINYPNNEVTRLLSQINPEDFSTLAQAMEFLESKQLDNSIIALILKNMEVKERKLKWKSNIPMLVSQYNNIKAKIELDTNNIPSLLIRGEKSNYVSNEDVLSLKEKLPNLKEDTILNANHWVHADQPTMFISSITKFLSKL